MKLSSHLIKANTPSSRWPTLLGACLIGLTSVSNVYADSRDQAKRMHDRLAGIPPTEEMLCAMADLIANSDATGAADLVMQTSTISVSGLGINATCDDGSDDVIDNSASKKAFYSVSLKNFITPWTNIEQTQHAPLNDYTATAIGIIRDDTDFREVLTGDYIYKGSAAYSNTDNTAYENLESSAADLSDSGVLMKATQSSVSIPGDAEDRGGVTTTRAAGEAFFRLGTNRRMFRYTLMNYMCRDLEEVKDISRVPDRIRQDVSRSPGGDSSIYLNSCIGCHSGMDPLAGAYAYYDWTENEDGSNGQLTYSRNIAHDPSRVDGAGEPDPLLHKFLINSNNFPYGRITTDNSWKNYWREGPNAAIGWPTSSSEGNGINSMNAELANTDAFAQCQVEKVYTHVCLQPPVDAHKANLDTIRNSFKGSYDLKQVFASTAELCMGL